MVGFEQAHHRRRACSHAALLLGLINLVADVESGAQTLAAAIRPEENPTMPNEDRPQGVERLFTQHARCTAVVVKDSGKRPVAVWLERTPRSVRLPLGKDTTSDAAAPDRLAASTVIDTNERRTG